MSSVFLQLMKKRAGVHEISAAAAGVFDEYILSFDKPDEQAAHMIELGWQAANFGSSFRRQTHAQIVTAGFIAALAAQALARNLADEDFYPLFDAVKARGRSDDIADILWRKMVNLKGQQVELDSFAIRFIEHALADEPDGEPSPVSADNYALAEQVDASPETIAEGFSALIEQRRYGVKPCYFPEESPGEESSWVVNDPYALIQAMQIPGIASQYVGLFHYGKGGVGALEDTVRSLQSVDSLQSLWELPTPGYEPQFSIGIDLAGELHVTGGCGLLPVSDVILSFAREDDEAVRNCRVFYRLLQVHLINQFAQLILPSEPELWTPRGAQHTNEPDEQKRLRNELEPVLRLPRRRLVYEMLEKEAREGEEEFARRSMRRHDVVWHIRTLGEGKHPSPQARAKAREFGIELADNETFVRPHQRGQGRKVGPHRARFER